jgi:hypothetical protein
MIRNCPSAAEGRKRTQSRSDAGKLVILVMGMSETRKAAAADRMGSGIADPTFGGDPPEAHRTATQVFAGGGPANLACRLSPLSEIQPTRRLGWINRHLNCAGSRDQRPD